MEIAFNKPFICGEELIYVQEAIKNNKLSGNGEFTQKCQTFLEQQYGFGKCLMTHSCTGALEMTALLMNIQPGDEVIVPAYTFVSTANAFLLRGAKIVFADSRVDHPNIDETKLEDLITPKTKAIVCVHYAGFPCELNTLRQLCDKYNLFLIEDAAQAIHSFYDTSNGKVAAGSVGDFATFSFHDTKNIHCGEGGALVINNPEFYNRADILWEKGTNKNAFLRGEVKRYEWVDIGSSFVLSEINAAFLWAQLQHIEEVTQKRQEHWKTYHSLFEQQDINIFCPAISQIGNAHIFYALAHSTLQRDQLILSMAEQAVHLASHYQNLAHADNKSSEVGFTNASKYATRLFRFPLHLELNKQKIENIFSIFVRNVIKVKQ